MREERIDVQGIPAKLYATGEARGLLLLGHGGGHGKDGPRFVSLARRYAERTGLAVVCMDAVDHGERKPPQQAPGIPRGWHSSHVPQMVQDWQQVVTGLGSIASPVAYVGFSMGAIFGVPIVAALRSIRAAVFVVGGIPAGGGIDDPVLETVLLNAASALHDVEVLMLNNTEDEIFPIEGVHALFRAIPGRSKRLMFWAGHHDDWSTELIEQSIRHLTEYTGP